MTPHAVTTLLGLSLFLACSPGGKYQPTPTVAERGPEPDDSTCDFIRSVAHPDPDTLIADFLRRDTRGDFLHTDGWLDSATTCPGHLPGPDFFTIVAGVRVIPLSHTSDTARYLAVYQRLGWTGYDSTGTTLALRAAPAVDTLRFRLISTNYGWRVDDPQMPQFVLAAAVRDRLPPHAQGRLDSLLRLLQ